MTDSRQKGKRGERETVHFWQDLFPDAHRHLEFREREAQEGVDVILDNKTGIQVKLGSKVPKKIYKMLEQLKNREGHLGFAQIRRDRKDWAVILWADDFYKIMESFLNGEEAKKDEMEEEEEEEALD